MLNMTPDEPLSDRTIFCTPMDSPMEKWSKPLMVRSAKVRGSVRRQLKLTCQMCLPKRPWFRDNNAKERTRDSSVCEQTRKATLARIE